MKRLSSQSPTATAARVLACKALLLLSLATGFAHAAKPDLDYERLRSSLSQLTQNPTLGPLAPAEIALAEQALAALAEQSGHSRQHDHLVYLAERRIDIANATAQAVEQEYVLQQLDREHDQILLAASRHDAELARLELEKQRIQNLAQAEEADRLRADAEAARTQSEQTSQEADTARQQAVQARKLADAQTKEAELARKEAALLGGSSAAVAKPTFSAVPSITLGENVFNAGKPGLRPAAQAQIARIADAAGASRSIRIEAYANDGVGPKSNLALSQSRANAVREALIVVGISAKRISAVGLGPGKGGSRHAVVSFSEH